MKLTRSSCDAALTMALTKRTRFRMTENFNFEFDGDLFATPTSCHMRTLLLCSLLAGSIAAARASSGIHGAVPGRNASMHYAVLMQQDVDSEWQPLFVMESTAKEANPEGYYAHLNGWTTLLCIRIFLLPKKRQPNIVSTVACVAVVQASAGRKVGCNHTPPQSVVQSTAGGQVHACGPSFPAGPCRLPHGVGVEHSRHAPCDSNS